MLENIKVIGLSSSIQGDKFFDSGVCVAIFKKLRDVFQSCVHLADKEYLYKKCKVSSCYPNQQ